MNLFTDHDILNIHKILGFGCLAHYTYRFGCKIIYGSMLFAEHSFAAYVAPVIHLSLSLSSFMFPVPKHRYSSKTIIWKELQLHNIIFTSRSVCMMYHTMAFTPNTLLYYYSRLAIVMAHHHLADIVTENYQNDDKTTTRDIGYNTKSQVIPYLNKKYYAVSQLAATVIMLSSTNYENGLLVMFPIQFSTFLMTLVRKNIITNNQWHILYALSLALPYLVNTHMINSKNDKLMLTAVFVISRLLFKVDKYINMLCLSIHLSGVNA
jgi:hypothetical protein